jgi:hypothetical protein
MAKAKLSKLIEELHGEIDGLVFREMPDGSIVVSKVPERKKKKATPAQNAYRKGTFKERTDWAQWAYKHYPIYEELAADLPMINAYNLALKDISHPPVIYRVQWEDGRILVNAWDEIMVESVRVRIHDEQGRLVEVGDAHQTQKDWWEYTPQAAGRISVTACDIPGNKACMDLEVPGSHP